jgi:hypothetical protein
MMHEQSILLILTRSSYFTILPLAFLFINKATRHYKINNMHFMSLNKFSNFIQVLNSKRKHLFRNTILPKHILFNSIYSLRK